MRILHIVSSLDPVYGGQPEVVKQLIPALSALGHQNEILTLDEFIYHFPEPNLITVISLAPSYGKYNLNFKLIPWLLKNVDLFDCVICHGIWQFQSYGTWLASRFKYFPFFVYVHGALNPWFRITYPLKHLKKWLYWPWAEYFVLKSANGVLFTSEGEKKQAANSFWLYKVNPVVVNSGIKDPDSNPIRAKEVFQTRYPDLKDKEVFLFMGRIHPIKGCDNLLKVFSEFTGNNPKLHCIMAGPDVIGWVPSLKELAKELNIEDRITWAGMLEGELKWGAIYSASCLILPSHTENFGLVVAESLACGTPVILTNKVNIWEIIENEKAGFVADDTIEGLRNSLQKWIDLNINKQNEMKENARKCFINYFEININAQKLIDSLQHELAKFGKKMKMG
ncbi:MAG: glycosyltransferase [Chloroflexi bacterium]|nr:glycosyltransferase [Chloroflexota bacterium]